ncbi:MAG TPA: ATP-binding protein [Kofleriaceae bacterium]|nr:ATP-binding protein [Kofleriaceae bacterium]
MARDLAALHLRAAGATGAAITRGHVEGLLARLDGSDPHCLGGARPAAATTEELQDEARLRIEATADGYRLPLDAMVRELGLDAFECEVLMLCAAVEIDGDYERIFGYVHDDLTRRLVSVELATSLTAESADERMARRETTGPLGKLRRYGLVAAITRETELREELRITPSCLAALLGAPIDLTYAFRDPAEARLAAPVAAPADEHLLLAVSRSIVSGRVSIAAAWGSPRRTRDVVAALAACTGRPVRRFPAAGQDLASATTTASALGALLWIDLDRIGERVPDEVIETCRTTRVPIMITGADPWRPTEMLADRDFVEIPLRPLEHGARATLWQHAVPELDAAASANIAATYRFDAIEIAAAARVARTSATLRSNGRAVLARDCLADACVAVARKHGDRHTMLRIPRRGAEDLVLPADLHTRVLDLVRYARALPRVMNDWGFQRRVSGAGIKALFCGDPGTGKTLAAEVIAKELALPLLRVDLARVVSKWVGETEKNLDHVFVEALDSHAVLFFDEAEALFGSRGDVRHGTDRYANLEVSYLLQRLEDHDGMVILATNLRDKIDPAFMRRFHSVIGFPRPAERERRKIWQRVLAPPVPVLGELDFSLLAKLDLTGAGIVGAAQTAAFVAADEDAPVEMRHVVRGLVRQFQREARVLSVHELGPHAVHAGG